MLSFGWGLAAVLGAVAGMLAAPTVFLDPNHNNVQQIDTNMRLRGYPRQPWL